MTISFVFLTVSKTMFLNRTYIISCVQDITKIFLMFIFGVISNFARANDNASVDFVL